MAVRREARGHLAGNLRSTYWRAWFDVSIAGRLDRSAFEPRPRVDAAILRVERRKHARVATDQHELYWRFLAEAFTSQAPVRRALQPSLSPLQIKRVARCGTCDLRYDQAPPYLNRPPVPVRGGALVGYSPQVPQVRQLLENRVQHRAAVGARHRLARLAEVGARGTTRGARRVAVGGVRQRLPPAMGTGGIDQWDELNIGSNRMFGVPGVLVVEGQKQVHLERAGTEDQLLLTMDVYQPGAAPGTVDHVALLRRNAWAFNQAARYDITTEPAALKLIDKEQEDVLIEATVVSPGHIQVLSARFYTHLGHFIEVTPDFLRIGGATLSGNVFHQTGGFITIDPHGIGIG